MLVKSVPKSQPLKWQKKHYSPWRRQLEVFLVVGSFLLALWWDHLWQKRSVRLRRQRAKWLVHSLLNLGPTFIKIGQSLSTRADILPQEYIDELSQLQDRVPPFSVEEAIALIELELSKPLYAIYEKFDRTPLAAASLGQVHRAQLHSGEQVVVKIQRPGLKKLFDVDMKAIYSIIKFCEKYLPWTRPYALEDIYNEFFTILYQEIDYIQEGKNADRFRQNFTGYARVIVPRIYWEYTTHKVLTIEYLPGVKIDDREGIEKLGLEPKLINQLGVCAYLKQLLLDGFFQADPHPGNLAITPDGSIIFYDFGMMVEVKSLTKDQMIKTFFAVLRKDTDEVLNTLILMGLVQPVPDMRPVRRLVEFLLERFTEKPIDFQMFREIKDELFIMFEQQPFRLPSQMIFILKSLTTLDGIARALDPQYNLVNCAEPFIKTITVTGNRWGMVSELARQAQGFIRYKLRQPNRVEVILQRLEKRIEQGELEIRVRSVESDRLLKKISIGVRCLVYACLTGFSFLGAIMILNIGYKGIAIGFFCLATFLFLFLFRSLVELALRERLDRLSEK